MARTRGVHTIIYTPETGVVTELQPLVATAMIPIRLLVGRQIERAITAQALPKLSFNAGAPVGTGRGCARFGPARGGHPGAPCGHASDPPKQRPTRPDSYPRRTGRRHIAWMRPTPYTRSDRAAGRRSMNRVQNWVARLRRRGDIGLRRSDSGRRLRAA